ncbi:MAG: GSCFA domain-containing protein [Prevotella sp.]|nr:GSCFA domain-containing protein [Prevotella sp.]
MEFRTVVDVPDPGFRIDPCAELLFVGSCFADSIGHRFQEEKFRVTVNPFGVMYNPASILHTVERLAAQALRPAAAFLTLGTNHVYRLKETGEIVDNCQKRPQALFTEEELSVDDCAALLGQTVTLLRQQNPDMRIVLTVSPIRYRKYGYHGSQLSKATLLLAADKVCRAYPGAGYFPAYEIVNDELRDYRFYKADMLHPSDQTVEYIWQRLSAVYLSEAAKTFLKEWAPLKAVLNHKPFNPDSEEYQALMDKTMLKVQELQKKYPNFAV